MPDSRDAVDQKRAADALRCRVADWAAGALEGRELDCQIARRQTPQERIDSGRDLIELAAKLRRA